jgi:hypothetical protein
VCFPAVAWEASLADHTFYANPTQWSVSASGAGDAVSRCWFAGCPTDARAFFSTAWAEDEVGEVTRFASSIISGIFSAEFASVFHAANVPKLTRGGKDD